MKVKFHIDYNTVWGESVAMITKSGCLPGFENNYITLNPVDGGWEQTLDISPAVTKFIYRYVIMCKGEIIRREWGQWRVLCADPHLESAQVYDLWQDRPSDTPFYTSAFADCFCSNLTSVKSTALEPAMLRLVVEAPMLPPTVTLAISGSAKALGQWDPLKSLALVPSTYPRWIADIPIERLERSFEYKFLIRDSNTGQVSVWENCDNRRITLPDAGYGTSVVYHGLRFANSLPMWRGAGVAIPVFSLRSNEDMGVGDFIDIKLLVDWAASTGQKFIQLLPINDTTMTGKWSDSYPYNAISTYALHPMYMRLENMMEGDKDAAMISRIDTLRESLNALPEVDYEAVNKAKLDIARALFFKSGSATLKSSPQYREFFEHNSHWLRPYAAFCVMRDKFGTADTSVWGECSSYSEPVLEYIEKEFPAEVGLYYYVQYHLDKQIRSVQQYAHEHGVALKGDIPIGISRNSVDAWLSPQLFNLSVSAGAPPDDFSILGQNWDFPTYNWDAMRCDGYAWWKARLGKMSEYFDAFRIDHVLGFFRIWQIPTHAIHGLLGTFSPALPLSRKEIITSYGFMSDPANFAKPYISRQMLDDIFGQMADDVIKQYLLPTSDNRYALRPPYDTQRKISEAFDTQSADDVGMRICQGLMQLTEQVLFIPDENNPNLYHPRIAAQHTYVYRSLTDYERQCFDALYNDFFYHRHNDFWYNSAMQKLPTLVDSTPMLVCAEDLGMIPECVPSVLNELNILSLEIQRMPKSPADMFADTAHYPYLSVCTTSTHDMGGIRQWWDEDPQATQLYFNQMLHLQGEAPKSAEPWICREILSRHLNSPSMLCILPLQDILAMDGTLRHQDPTKEQINEPSNPRHYWRYRMHLSLEQLKDSKEFNKQLLQLITQSNR